MARAERPAVRILAALVAIHAEGRTPATSREVAARAGARAAQVAAVLRVLRGRGEVVLEPSDSSKSGGGWAPRPVVADTITAPVPNIPPEVDSGHGEGGVVA